MSRTPSKSPATSAENAAATRGTRIFLGLSCFLAGAAMMVIEICAYRLLAPFFGNSVYTWTALIGVILIAFSAGGYLGGHLADRKMALDLLGWLLSGSAVLTFFIPALHTVFAVGLSAHGLIAGPVMISLLLFAIPGILLGAVSPAAVRFYSLTLKDTHVGAAAGTISMLGSLGSFVGTFLSGFFLLSTFGVRSIFFGTAALLLVLAVAAFILAKNSLKQQAPVIMSGIFAFGMSWMTAPKPKAGVIFEHESFYHHIEVSEQREGSVTRRVLQLDSTMEGGMDATTGDLILPYQQYWKLALLREPAKVGFGNLPDTAFRDLIWYVLAPPEEGPLTKEKKELLIKGVEDTVPSKPKGNSSRAIDWESVSLWNPDWTVSAPDFERTPMKLSEYYGRKNVLLIHPFPDKKTPASFERKLKIEPGKTHLKATIAADDRGDWTAKAVVNGAVVKEMTVDHEKPRWKTLEIDLSKFVGQEVTLRLEAHANGWNMEFAYWSGITLE